MYRYSVVRTYICMYDMCPVLHTWYGIRMLDTRAHGPQPSECQPRHDLYCIRTYVHMLSLDGRVQMRGTINYAS